MHLLVGWTGEIQFYMYSLDGNKTLKKKLQQINNYEFKLVSNFYLYVFHYFNACGDNQGCQEGCP